jgi:hypothetical protein
MKARASARPDGPDRDGLGAENRGSKLMAAIGGGAWARGPQACLCAYGPNRHPAWRPRAGVRINARRAAAIHTTERAADRSELRRLLVGIAPVDILGSFPRRSRLTRGQAQRSKSGPPQNVLKAMGRP